jgi:signal transduction histidine kinase
MKCRATGYDQPVGFQAPDHAARTHRTIVLLRAVVATMAIIHVALVGGDLAAGGLLVVGIAAVCALLVSTAWSLRVLMTERPGPMVASTWGIALVDAFALITIARITVGIDPTATIAWAFVLWAPFSIAIRATPAGSLIGSLSVSGLVLASTMFGAGALEPLPMTWTAVGVPMVLVLVAGVLTTLATLSQHRSGLQVRRELSDERDRALRLREADDLKNTFLAAVSHELRTPLTSILGFAVTMLDRPELDDAQRERMLRTVVAEAEHLEDILANLLDLDRLTRGKATLVAVDVDPATVVAAAVQQVQQRSGRIVKLDLQEGLRMQLDSSKVERIVENLVGNAAKYTPPDAEISVRMRADSGGLLICVDDNGPGIGRELRDRIFEPFRRGADIGVPGTGIGLSLVDHFSRMHGGRAWVEERPGGGCRFQVYLVPASPTLLPALGDHGASSTANHSSMSSVHG